MVMLPKAGCIANVWAHEQRAQVHWVFSLSVWKFCRYRHTKTMNIAHEFSKIAIILSDFRFHRHLYPAGLVALSGTCLAWKAQLLHIPVSTQHTWRKYFMCLFMFWSGQKSRAPLHLAREYSSWVCARGHGLRGNFERFPFQIYGLVLNIFLQKMRHFKRGFKRAWKRSKAWVTVIIKSLNIRFLMCCSFFLSIFPLSSSHTVFGILHSNLFVT